ncbi:MAG: phosphoglycolate phosphatase [Novosphingobium lindaniclasticum]|jgi:phosphoglycolate phosphatase|uniref:HAD-IA family hydrolase n=1 Tax=Novosphingobium lindaniclasticum TaxID=1329895 RepID=UPI00240A3BD8|nr:HAD-IA family hydrolase [Novosphingobium lindaniclasticum]MDF2638900.1 phosphoglycolate phosphatase [Novosphingobium lindaniclasticum]
MTDFPFDIVGFDLDGTLLDSLGDLGVALNHALSLEGRAAIPRDAVRDLVGGGARKMLAKGLEVTGGPVSDERLNELHHALIEFYSDHVAVETRLYPGGEAMLQGLAARDVKIAVVTNKLEGLAVKIFAEMGLSHHFFTVIGGDTLGPGRAKPKPDLIELMLERAGGGRAAFVGDTTYDTGAAAAAGIPCVAVSFGFNDRPPQDLGAAAVIDHFDDLIPTLARIGAEAETA